MASGNRHESSFMVVPGSESAVGSDLLSMADIAEDWLDCGSGVWLALSSFIIQMVNKDPHWTSTHSTYCANDPPGIKTLLCGP